MKGKNVEDGVYSIFSELAGMLGYSPIHGKIIGALVAENRPVSLQELAKRTSYSMGMVSLSLDLLEVLGVIKKIKKPGDRKLYLQLEGDLLTILKKAVTMRVQKGVEGSLKDLEEKRKEVQKLQGKEREYLIRTLDILERDIRRLEKYVGLLSVIKLP
jgi:DNA-binding transcriptional regulator GbsR (MarR family)